MLNLFRRPRKTDQGLRRTREVWWGKVRGLLQRPAGGAELWDDLEELLISADVGVSTTTKLIERLRERVRSEKAAAIEALLKEEIVAILQSDDGAEAVAPGEGLRVILVIGVNGVGKTTSIAKLAHSLKSQGKRVMLAASDTFRAAAIEQLQYWGNRVGVEVIAHQPGGDPGAVVFDALEAAKKRADFLIVDTAGRLHTKFNLMEELKKMRRVVARFDTTPEVLLVLDATTGQNGLSQARSFAEAVAVSGIFLAKLDSTAKGGIVLAICDELNIPINFLGTGQELDDLAPFDAREFVEALFSPKG